jgi:hypothetical protein
VREDAREAHGEQMSSIPRWRSGVGEKRDEVNSPPFGGELNKKIKY